MLDPALHLRFPAPPGVTTAGSVRPRTAPHAFPERAVPPSRTAPGPLQGRAAGDASEGRVSASSRAQHSWGTGGRGDQGGAEGEAASSVATLQGRVLRLGRGGAPSHSAHRPRTRRGGLRGRPSSQRLLTGRSPARPVRPEPLRIPCQRSPCATSCAPLAPGLRQAAQPDNRKSCP